MVSTSRIQGLNVGVTDIQHWRHRDETHLPDTMFRPQPFLPRPDALDSILRRETLDERLARHVIPADISSELLHPAVMSATRMALQDRFRRAFATATGRSRERLKAAADLLEKEVELDHEIQEALAVLLRG